MSTPARASASTAPARHLPGVVVIAASAGGLEPIAHLLSQLPASLPVPVVVVQHLDPRHVSHLAQILERRSRLPIVVIEAGTSLAPGVAYVAPPDHHVQLDRAGHASLSQEPEVHFVRPSADVLFSSAAKAYAGRVVAVVLSGMGVDGASGAVDIRAAGGAVICQDEATAKFYGMPGAVIREGAADAVLPLAEIPAAIVELLEGTPG